MFKKILLAYDGSEGPKKPRGGINLAKTHQASSGHDGAGEIAQVRRHIDEVQEEKELRMNVMERFWSRPGPGPGGGLGDKNLKAFGHPLKPSSKWPRNASLT